MQMFDFKRACLTPMTVALVLIVDLTSFHSSPFLDTTQHISTSLLKPPMFLMVATLIPYTAPGQLECHFEKEMWLNARDVHKHYERYNAWRLTDWTLHFSGGPTVFYSVREQHLR